MKKTVLFLTLFFSICVMSKTSQKGDVSKTLMTKKWHRLYALIEKEIKTIKTRVHGHGPRLLWRLIELDTEKLKLIKEKENQTFLKATLKERKRKNKAHYFKESRRLYSKIKRDGLNIIKRYPRFRNNSEIFYTLALNSRDYGGDKETEKFLHLSLKNSFPKSPIIHAAKTGLAEYYYNNKKYKTAIHYYKSVLKSKEDEWRTKHLFNVSWCYLKTNQYSKAIEMAKESFKDSGLKTYINVREQVLESIGLFFVLDEKVEEGTNFYIENVRAPGPYLIKMAKKTAEDRGYEKAFTIYNKALKNSLSKKNKKEEILIRLSQLDFFRNFKKYDRFWNTSKAIDEINTTSPLTKEERNQAIEKIKSFVGYLQIRFTKNSKLKITDYKEENLRRIIQFFDILTRIDKTETDQYRYFQGETYFSTSRYLKSFFYYQKALEFNKSKVIKRVKKGSKEVIKTTPNKLTQKIFDSLLASLEYGTFKKSKEQEYTIYTYTNHLYLYPKNERTRLIYEKLFNLYLKNKKISDARKTLDKYILTYPADKIKQQKMFTRMFDSFILTKNTEKLAYWIPKLKKGYLEFDSHYIEKAIIMLGNLLFDSYQKLHLAGKKEEAAQGYVQLYQSEKYPQSIKAKSAFRTSLIYLELYKTKQASKWMQLALKLFNPKERFKRKNEILAVVHKLMLSQDFNSSAFLASQYIKTYCTSPFKEKTELFKASVRYPLLEGHYKQAILNFYLGQKCRIKKKIQNEVLVGIGQYFVKNRKFGPFISYFKKYKKKKWLTPFFDEGLLSFYKDFYKNKETKNMQRIELLLKDLKKIKGHRSDYRKELDLVISFKKIFPELEKTIVSDLPIEKQFSETNFNNKLEANIETLKRITQKVTPFIKSGNPTIMTLGLHLLEKKYRSLGNKLFNYIPRGVSKEYLKGFKETMKDLANNFFSEADEQKRIAIKFIENQELLSYDYAKIINLPKVFDKIGHRHLADLYILPKDRMGGTL